MDSKQELFDAIKAGDLARVNALIARDASLAAERDGNGLSAILLARYHFKLDVLQALLAAHPPLDIFEAAAVGETSRVAELLAADSSLPQAMSKDGGTALHLAAFFRSADAAELLIKAGGDVNSIAPGFGNVTPLHSAAAGHETRIVEALLKAGADPNLRQNGGWTPLHETAMSGNIEGTRLLLAHGADASLTNDTGQTPLDLAEEKGHRETADLIRQAQAARASR
jgi:uncharacterized protein